MRLRNLFTLFAVATLVLLTACNKDENPVNDSANLLEQLTKGEKSACYDLQDYKLYESNSSSPLSWNEVNLTDFLGWMQTPPSKLIVSEGKTWVPLSFWTSYGPSSLYLPFVAYCKTTGFNKDVYVVSDFIYDKDNNTVKIEDNTYSVQYSDDTKLIVDLYHNTNKGQLKEVAIFKIGELTLLDKSKIVYYDNEYDAYMAIIQMIRDEFGNSFNLNDYLGDNIILDDPMVNLDEIEQEIEHLYLDY